MSTPKVFILRHGETEWSLNGRYTGVTDIPLTANGERRVTATGQAMIGEERLIVPKKLAHIYVSPRVRAQRTFELLNIEPSGPSSPPPVPTPSESSFPPLPWSRHGPHAPRKTTSVFPSPSGIEVTESIREWDYGEYEGLTTAQIRELRQSQGRHGRWDIWRDGCVGGESAEEVTHRLDELIKDIKDRFHRHALAEPPSEDEDDHTPCDVLVVAHGHILRALAMRWLGHSLVDGPTFLMEAGGVGTLSYAHHNIEEPAIVLGSAFYVGLHDD